MSYETSRVGLSPKFSQFPNENMSAWCNLTCFPYEGGAARGVTLVHMASRNPPAMIRWSTIRPFAKLIHRVPRTKASESRFATP